MLVHCSSSAHAQTMRLLWLRVGVMTIAASCTSPTTEKSSTASLARIQPSSTSSTTRPRSTTAIEPPTTLPAPTTTATTTTTAVASTVAATVTLNQSMLIDGRVRTWIVHVPATRDHTAMPLLIVLHGARSDAARFEAKTGYDDLADRDHFLVVYPDGFQPAASSTRTWNAGQCCPPASAAGIDDTRFVIALLDRMEHDYPIDTGRVYLVGHSNGAMLAQRLGCEHPQRFAAVASVAGSMTVPRCTAQLPVSMLEIHGSADVFVPLASAQAAIARWRAVDRCNPNADITTTATTVTRSWRCDDGSDVRLMEIIGAEHPWPGQRTPPSANQHTSAVLDASAVTWAC